MGRERFTISDESPRLDSHWLRIDESDIDEYGMI